ncbi:hypothetical protein [Breznakia pachnodae]|uniref:Cellobiose-specific phosphotransferase system component IIC n=1 Tax=Breznakia pachnodae TaxID=265178 RepID=A0ABU0E8V1_9FIRM|nr:hypothetical protein [Breznakia pachnodae]MDQ0363281.1 cellobiose-specific phosphotransferase system component IIC [Breznakia pachnodae]
MASGLFRVYEPLILTPVIISVISYLAFSVGLVAFTTGVTLPCAVLFIISGVIVINSISGTILQIEGQ